MTLVPAKVSNRRRLFLFGRRVRRFTMGILRRGYIRRHHVRRRGACQRCGACCQMGSRCPSLAYEGSLAVCMRYETGRPMNCRNYPIDERDLRDRDFIAPGTPCGYWFEDGGE